MIVVAWTLFALGAAHIAYGAIRFKVPLAEAWSAGFIGKFAATEARRSAFWFLMAGPLLMALGQVSVHAVAESDHWLLRVVGAYLLVASGVGVAAFPKSPLWVPLLLSPSFIVAGFGHLA